MTFFCAWTYFNCVYPRDKKPANFSMIKCLGTLIYQFSQKLLTYYHIGQCKRTGGCYNELVVAFSALVVAYKVKNLYLLTLLFIYKLAFILFVMTPGAQTTGNIAVYGSAKQLVILFMVWTANPTKFWSFAVTGAFF